MKKEEKASMKNDIYSETTKTRPAPARELYVVGWSFQSPIKHPHETRAHVIGSLVFDNEKEAKKALAIVDR